MDTIINDFQEKGIVIYGAGNRGMSLCDILLSINANVVCMIDKKKGERDCAFKDVPIKSINHLQKYQDHDICIALADEVEVEKTKTLLCSKYGFRGRYIDYFKLLFTSYEKYVSHKATFVTPNHNKVTIAMDSIQGFGLGGVEVWLRSLCAKLDRSREIRILTDNAQHLESDSVEGMLVNLDIKHDMFWGRENFDLVFEYLMKERPSIHIINNTDIFMIASVLIKQQFPNEVKLISVIHQGEAEYYDVNSLFHKYIDHYIGVSRDIVQELIKRGVDEKKCESMTCPVYVPRELERDYSTDKKKPICIGYAGRLVIRKKRIDILNSLIDELINNNVDFNLFIAGKGKDSSLIEKTIIDKSLENRVVLLGVIPHDAIPLFWKDKDICINTSDCEGRCISKLEGMAMGCVPVVTNVAGTSEDITYGENGFYVEPGDYHAMAKSIKKLADNRELLINMGRKSYLKVKQKCDFTNHVEYWEKLFDKYQNELLIEETD